MKRMNPRGDEEIRAAFRTLKEADGTDLKAAERLVRLLRRRTTEEERAKTERELEEERFEEARSLLRQEYYESVSSHAEDIVEGIRKGNITEVDELRQRISEDSDSNYWTIYTHASQQAIWASENADYGIEEGLVSLERGEIPWGAIASYAFMRDLEVAVEAEGIDLNDESEWPVEGKEEEEEEVEEPGA